jgi:molybdenum cofactor cytidylyltransferase
MRVGCAVLAAGAGLRFGDGVFKLAAEFRGKPLLQWAVDAACGSRAASCSVVLGARWPELLGSVDLRRCAALLNDAAVEGIGSSIRCAAAAHGSYDALILMLGDQPNVTQADLDALIGVFENDARRMVALRRGDVWGAPMLFPRTDLAVLTRIGGDAGAKRYAALCADRLSFVESCLTDAFADVDVPADLVTRRI